MKYLKHISNLEAYPALKSTYDFSCDTIVRLSTALAGKFGDNIQSVITCGSLARLEASECSDVDFMVIVKSENKQEWQAEVESLQILMKANEVNLPNPKGVFAMPRTLDNLINRIGQADEESDIYAKRMLLLMESRYLFNDDNYKTILSSVFDRYANYVIQEPKKEFLLLLNDLVRYFRYICLNYEFHFGHENEKWPLRNIKLRHSRVLIYAGLLVLIGESSKLHTDKHLWLRQQLELTPLDRLAMVYQANEEGNFDKVLKLYDKFLTIISSPGNRATLNKFDYESRYKNEMFKELKDNSDSFITELTRFIFARRGQWSDRFFEYLVF